MVSFWRRTNDPEVLYHRGVRLWRERDLDRAADAFRRVIAAPPSGRRDWSTRATTALVRLSLERDDLATVRQHLDRLSESGGVADGLVHVLEARYHLSKGEPEAAEISVSLAAMESLSGRGDGRPSPRPQLLWWASGALADLGYGDEASRLVGLAREVPGVGEDALLSAGLTVVEAASARLSGSTDTAAALLAAVDPSPSPEVGIQVQLESARLAWIARDKEGAREQYHQTEGAARRQGYLALARLARAEAVAGPTIPKRSRWPVEEWAVQRQADDLEDLRNHAVVVRLVVNDHPESYLRLQHDVTRALAARPGLGRVEVAGNEGGIWELCLDGEDPDALWEAVAPVVTGLARSGSRVRIRRNDMVQTIPLP